MPSNFGNALKITVFGQSHGAAIGVVMEGLPAGQRIDEEALYAFLRRRRPGSALATSRLEEDRPRILSGLRDGVTCGSPLAAMIENTDARSGDYSEIWDKPRPSHADYTARLRYGDSVDLRGGGHFSGRLTAPLCIAGGIAKQCLEGLGVYVGAHLAAVGDAEDVPFPLHPTREQFDLAASREVPVLDEAAGERMAELIAAARDRGDSVGGVVECAAIGVPAGLGSPMFGGVESRLSSVLFGVPAVKGLEFGSGFRGAARYGSENNDPFIVENGRVRTSKNDAGGILGGITTGMPVILRAAIKPTPSISLPQETVDLRTLEPAELKIRGRHDPCIALRAVPVIEAVTAAVIYDMILEERHHGTF